MAVKVMLAPAIASRAIEKDGAGTKRGLAAKPRRRRSSVYDADGNEVFISLVCPKCHKTRPLSLFGLRKMADGAIRNQPWCRTCRSGAGAGAGLKGGREDSPEIVESPAATPSPPADRANEPKAPAARPANPAAEVAAALSAGLRR